MSRNDDEVSKTDSDASTEEQARKLVTAYRADVAKQSYQWNYDPSKSAIGREILKADPAIQVAVMRGTLDLAPQGPMGRAFYTLVSLLAKRRLPYTLEDIEQIAGALSSGQRPYLPAQALVRSISYSLDDAAMLAAARPSLEELSRKASALWYASADKRKFLRLLSDILGDTQGALGVDIRSDEWGDQVSPLLGQMDESTREPWTELLNHCAKSSGTAPSAKWAAEAGHWRAKLDTEVFATLAAEWLGAFLRSGNKPPTRDPETYERANPGCLLDEGNADLLRGLAWSCAEVENAKLDAALADAAIAGYRKITGVGPRSAKVAGACVYALKMAPGLHGAAQLERVRLNVKQPTYSKGIEKALDTAAERSGMTREDLEELTVPTFGLEDGRLRLPIGSAVAELEIQGADVALRWYGADGALRKSEPADVKREHKAELKDLKRQHADLSRMLVAQRDRVERLPLAQRQWNLAAWRERYLDHPLVSSVARRLIWRFSWPSTGGAEPVAEGAWREGVLVGADDQPLAIPETATVTLWHPVYANAETVLAWREWLERHQVTQPFKQAHREVYLLTDAERHTQVYSNRFSAHILRQHQFNALCAARGWRNTLRLMVDDEYPPATIELPQWNLRAEFWIEGAGTEYHVDTNETGTYLYVATDQVRFYPLHAEQNYAHATGGGYHTAYGWRRTVTTDDDADRRTPVALEDMPPLVFSEIMRDVDLFVGVASVGNDPTWQDGGPQGRYLNYWQSYSFGDLSATAQTRKQLLERLVPRLAIADRCAITGRFLTVRGDLRTYKIHLGSGNILMEPNDQYLCIVPGRDGALSAASSGDKSAPNKLFLPFEGDTVLAIILSKAFLLAEDTKITDQTITRQISRV